jgi:hypothetical protein
MRLIVAAALAASLTGCATAKLQQPYVRTDGAPVDAAKQQATLAQCKGEGALAVPAPTDADFAGLDAARKEVNVINACMARNGYIRPQ